MSDQPVEDAGRRAPGQEHPEPDPTRQVPPPLDQMLRTRRRRTPKYPVFIGLGVFVGVLVAVVATYSLPATREFGYGSVVGYAALTMGLTGGLVGGIVAVVLDRRH